MVETSFLQMFFNASAVVQLIMLALIFVSILSWSYIYQRSCILARANKNVKNFEKQFWSGADLTKLYDSLTSDSKNLTGEGVIFVAGFKEFIRLRSIYKNDIPTLLECINKAMNIALNKEMVSLEKQLPFFATVGSVSPYVGLFGTVWGIMHAFMALGGSEQQATLSMVAPGIAEALVATAMGLFAAIPAVIAYNRFTTKVDLVGSQYATFIDEFSGVLHRQAHSFLTKT